jgi:hypothetical protein
VGEKTTGMAPSSLTAKKELVEQHYACEMMADWNGALATLTDDAYYEYYPGGIRVRGPEAITEQWKRVFSLPAMSGDAGRNMKMRQWFPDEDTAILIAEWPVVAVDGTEKMTTSWAVFKFVNGLILSETVFADSVLAPLLEPVYDEEFLRLPGVELIKS